MNETKELDNNWAMEGYNDIVKKLASTKEDDPQKWNLIHAGMGLASESGEILDQLKAHIFYGKELDVVNLVEEAGDILWFLSLLLQQFGMRIEDAVAGNRVKLARRYGEDFDPVKALKRDKAAEIQALKEVVGLE